MFIEQLSNPNNRINLSNKVIKWDYKIRLSNEFIEWSY